MSPCPSPESLDALLEERLSAAEQKAVETPVEECLACQTLLSAELRVLAARPDRDKPEGAAEIVRQLTHWAQDPDFAGVRGAGALDKLPEEERAGWRKLWGDSDELLRKTAKWRSG